MHCLVFAILLSSMDAQSSINKVLEDWHQAAAKADENAYFNAMTEDSIYLGTDATERWNKTAFRKFAHPYFAQGKAWTFAASRRDVMLSADGKLAWFDEDLKTQNLGPVRGSGVLRLEKDGWKIVHYNLSVTIPNEKFPAVKKLLDEETKK
ncbi:MAG: nuclear transport factor 2 family protein [Planctomycetia bacterium]|nr:nuclear transport factor 2 family protein [Planctomycetia bacterium]